MTALDLAQQLDPSAVAAWVGHPYDVGTIGEDVVALGWMPAREQWGGRPRIVEWHRETFEAWTGTGSSQRRLPEADWMHDAVRDLLAADTCMPGAGRVYVRRPLPLLTRTGRH